MNKKNLQTLESLVKEQKKVNQLMNEQNMARLNIRHALKDIITPKEELKTIDPSRIEAAQKIENVNALRHNQLLNTLTNLTPSHDKPPAYTKNPPIYWDKDGEAVYERTMEYVDRKKQEALEDKKHILEYNNEKCVGEDKNFEINDVNYDSGGDVIIDIGTKQVKVDFETESGDFVFTLGAHQYLFSDFALNQFFSTTKRPLIYEKGKDEIKFEEFADYCQLIEDCGIKTLQVTDSKSQMISLINDAFQIRKQKNRTKRIKEIYNNY